MTAKKKTGITKKDIKQVERLLVDHFAASLGTDEYATVKCVNTHSSNYRVNLWRKQYKPGMVIASQRIFESYFVVVTQVRNNVPKYKVLG